MWNRTTHMWKNSTYKNEYFLQGHYTFFKYTICSLCTLALNESV